MMNRDEIMVTSVDEFEWSARVSNAFRNNGIATVADLVSLTEAELLRFDNFGRESLREVKEEVARLGLRLGVDLNERDKRLLEPGTIDLCLRTVRDNVEAMLAMQRASRFNRQESMEHHRAVVIARMDELDYIARSWALDRGREV